MADATDFSEKMAELQKLRVAVVILLSQENSKLLSRRQKVAGKEIEVMCAERDVAQGDNPLTDKKALERLYEEEAAVRQVMAETEAEIQRMEQLMAKIDKDIAALCQA